MHTHARTHVHAHMRMCMHACACMQLCIDTHMHAHTQTLSQCRWVRALGAVGSTGSMFRCVVCTPQPRVLPWQGWEGGAEPSTACSVLVTSSLDPTPGPSGVVLSTPVAVSPKVLAQSRAPQHPPLPKTREICRVLCTLSNISGQSLLQGCKALQLSILELVLALSTFFYKREGQIKDWLIKNSSERLSEAELVAWEGIALNTPCPLRLLPTGTPALAVLPSRRMLGTGNGEEPLNTKGGFALISAGLIHPAGPVKATSLFFLNACCIILSLRLALGGDPLCQLCRCGTTCRLPG